MRTKISTNLVLVIETMIHMHPTGGGAKGYTENIPIAYKEQERLPNQVFYLMTKFLSRARKK